MNITVSIDELFEITNKLKNSKYKHVQITYFEREDDPDDEENCYPASLSFSAIDNDPNSLFDTIDFGLIEEA